MGSTPPQADVPYRIFQNFDDAALYFLSWEMATHRYSDRPVYRVMPASDPHYQRALPILARVFQEFQKMKPELLSLPVPQLVITEDASIFAGAPGPMGNDSDLGLPFVFNVTSGTLDASIGDGELTGLFAHELTHLLFRHTEEGKMLKIARFYRASAAGEPLGYQQKNDLEAQKVAMAWLQLAEDAGSFSLEQLHGLSFQAQGSFTGKMMLYPTLQSFILARFTDEQRKRPECISLQKSSAEMGVFLNRKFSMVDWNLRLDDAGLSELDLLATAMTNDMKQCYAGLRVGLIDLLTNHEGERRDRRTFRNATSVSLIMRTM